MLKKLPPEPPKKIYVETPLNHTDLDRIVKHWWAPIIKRLAPYEQAMSLLKYMRSNEPLPSHSELLQQSIIRERAHGGIEQLFSVQKIFPSEKSEQGYIIGWTEKEILPYTYISVHLNTPVGIGLFYKKNKDAHSLPIAALGFWPRNETTLMTYQIQGVRPYTLEKTKKIPTHGSRGLFYIDWEQFLVSYSEKIASSQNFQNMGILAGKNNTWMWMKDRARAHARYDETAKKLNYTQRADGNWYKALDSQNTELGQQ